MASHASKTKVMAYALAHGIEIEDDGQGIERHIHGYAPTGYVFAMTETHNIGLYDAGWSNRVGVRWDDVMEQLALMPCPHGEACETCHGGD